MRVSELELCVGNSVPRSGFDSVTAHTTDPIVVEFAQSFIRATCLGNGEEKYTLDHNGVVREGVNRDRGTSYLIREPTRAGSRYTISTENTGGIPLMGEPVNSLSIFIEPCGVHGVPPPITSPHLIAVTRRPVGCRAFRVYSLAQQFNRFTVYHYPLHIADANLLDQTWGGWNTRPQLLWGTEFIVSPRLVAIDEHIWNGCLVKVILMMSKTRLGKSHVPNVIHHICEFALDCLTVLLLRGETCFIGPD